MPTVPQTMTQALFEPTPVMFVAIESGAQWPSSLRPQEGLDLIVVAQVFDEDLPAFTQRSLTKLGSVVDRGSPLTSAALLVAPTFDRRYLEARCVIARALAQAFRRGARSTLYLVEPRLAGVDCRPHLAALAEGLAENAATDYRIQVGPDAFAGAAPESNPTSNLVSGRW